MPANRRTRQRDNESFVRTLLIYLLSDVADLTLFFTVGGFLAMLVLLFR